MANKELRTIFCLTISLLALLLGACATTQNKQNRSPEPVAESPASGSRDVAAAKRRSRSSRSAAPEQPSYNDLWGRIRDGFRLRDLESPHVDYYVEWYAARPEYVERMVDRASKYLYYIVEELERHDFPMEIALLPAIESAYQPGAYSRAHAVGLWQFISATGRRYGLKQNWWYDGRRDVVGATDAAIRYLGFLHDEFNGDWFHALAAYNTGERRVRRAIVNNRRRGKPTDYEHLRLRRETMRYIPKLLAVKRIVQDPARYNLTLRPIPNRPYFQIVETGSQIDLSIVAEAAGISPSELRDLNPGFRRWATDPSGPHRVLVPVESGPRVASKLASIPEERRMRWASYNVRRGDTLGRIARRYGVSVSALQSSNRLRGTLIRAGQTLLVPLSTQALASSASAPARAAAKEQGNQPLRWARHRIRRGDTLSRIARRYGVSVAVLRSSNGLRGSLIRAGRTLRIPLSEAPGSGQQTVIHRVRRGDTLWGIARRYKVRVRQLQHWNEIASQDVLRLGQRIMVYLN